MENKDLKININAKAFKRVASFFIDNILMNFIVVFFIQMLVFNSSNIKKIAEFGNEFKNLYGSIKLSEIKDYHVRYVVNSVIFDCFVNCLLITIIVSILYNFLSYLILNSSTIGQKIFSLKVVNIKDNNKPNIVKLFIKSLLVQLPFNIIYIMGTCSMLYLLNFHLYAPMKNITTILLIKITAISNIYTLGVILLFLFLFWFNIYYICDRLILSDIISRTRVIDSRILDITNTNRKDITYYIDKLFEKLEKINNMLKNQLKKWIEFLKNRK